MLYHSHNLRSICQNASTLIAHFFFFARLKDYLLEQKHSSFFVHLSSFFRHLCGNLNAYIARMAVCCCKCANCNLLSCDLFDDFKINFAFRRKSVISWNSSTKCRHVNISIPTPFFFARYFIHTEKNNIFLSLSLSILGLMSENAHSNN